MEAITVTSAATSRPSGLALLSTHRPEVLQAYLDLTPRLGESLDPVTKQLIRIAMQVSTGSHRDLRSSVPRAIAEGATCDQIIDAVVLALPEVGLSRVVDALTVVSEFVESAPGESRAPSGSTPRQEENVRGPGECRRKRSGVSDE